jgi:sugar (pentulose or hexulose) kinase
LRQRFSDTLIELSRRIDPSLDSPLDYYPLPRAGERFPHNDPNFVPRLSPRPEDNAQFLHGLLQGLARIEAAGYAKLIELGATPLESVTTCGSGAKNSVLQQIRARYLGVPVSTASHTEAAYGAALLGKRAAIM